MPGKWRAGRTETNVHRHTHFNWNCTVLSGKRQQENYIFDVDKLTGLSLSLSPFSFACKRTSLMWSGLTGALLVDTWATERKSESERATMPDDKWIRKWISMSIAVLIPACLLTRSRHFSHFSTSHVFLLLLITFWRANFLLIMMFTWEIILLLA